MTDSKDSSSFDASGEFDRILAEYLRRIDQGQTVDTEAFLELYPDFAEELREYFETEAKYRDAPRDATIHFHAQGGSRPVHVAPKFIRYFGDYQLLDEIGRGGQGVVYRAEQTKLNRIVAVKMILAGQLATDTDVKRFHAEAELAANINHPNIVDIYEVGEHEGQHYFSMPFVIGRSLADLTRDNPLEPDLAAGYVATLANAIHHAHEEGVVHRDLKPSNVLIDEHGKLHVTDFGLAKRLEGAELLTTTGQIVGTPGYMSPEQIYSGETGGVDRRCDVYSMGAILYHLLTSRPPFVGAAVVDTLRQVRFHDPVAPRAFNDGISRDLETVCLKCLEKDPQDRYGTARELADELQRYLNGEPILARPVSNFVRGWRWCKRNPLGASLTGAVATLLLLLGVGGPWIGYLESQKAEAERQHAQRLKLEHRRLVHAQLVSLETGEPHNVPFLIDVLRPPSEELQQIVRDRYKQSEQQDRKIRLAVGVLGLDDEATDVAGFIVKQINVVKEKECDNLVAALRSQDRDAMKALLRKGFDAQAEPQRKARLAIIALFLNDESLASEMLGRPEGSKDFAQEFSSWRPDVKELAVVTLRSKNAVLQTGMCDALARCPVQTLSQSERRVWRPTLTLLSQSSDASTSAAATRLLARWDGVGR